MTCYLKYKCLYIKFYYSTNQRNFICQLAVSCFIINITCVTLNNSNKINCNVGEMCSEYVFRF